MGKTSNTYADMMLEKISKCVEQETKNLPSLSGAIVSSVNTDGTINVYFPPENNKIFTNISNQTPFSLEPGDSVELLLKDGSYNNCWIVAKHQTTYNGITDIGDIMQQYATLDDLAKVQSSLITETDPFFNASPAATITQQQITQWNNATVVVPTSTTPKMDAAASVGSENAYARGDHVHPKDTSKADILSPNFSGTPTAPTPDSGANNTQIATTEFVNTAISGISYPVSSVNNKTGAVTLTASDVSAVPTSRKINNYPLTSDITLTANDVEALPNTTLIPSKTSQLTNDSGFITSASIPEETFVTTYDGTSADHTYAEIKAASEAGKVCILIYGLSTYLLEYTHSTYLVFSKSGTAGTGDNEQGFIAYAICTSSNAWSTNSLTVSSKNYVDNLVNSLGTVLNFKGTVTNYSDLPSSGNTVGDVWIVTSNSAEYVWDGTSWESFGPTIDLSGYLQINNLASGTGNSTTTAMTQDATTQALNTKANVAYTVSNVAYDTTNKKITKTINGTTSDVVTISTIKDDLEMTAADVGALPDSTDLTIYMQKGVDYVTAGKKSTTTLGANATAEGYSTTASGDYSHAEGNGTSATGPEAHAEGYNTTASGGYSHAEGVGTEALALGAHAEGSYSSSSAMGAHAEGRYTTASGRYSHAEGIETIAAKLYQHVFGKYNIGEDGSGATLGTYAEIVGNGTATDARSNARTLDWSGNEVLAGKLTVGTGPTNNMDVATKQYVDTITPVATSTTPVMDGTATSGAETAWAKGDHVHPTDTTRAPVADPDFTGVPLAPTAQVGTNTRQIATTEFVQSAIVAAGGGPSPSIADPLMDGVASPGSAAPYSREDHVHPTDTSRAPLASPALTGTPTAPTAATGTDTTQIATTAFVNASISALGSVLNYKGTKATTSELPQSGNTTGDVWIVTADNSEHVWNGSSWEELGPTIDLSGYVPNTRTINNKALSSDITLTYSDVGALPDSTTIPGGSNTTPSMDGTAAVGSETTWAHGDHVHPTDTSRAASNHTHGNITNAGDITATATIASGDRIVINDESASKITNSSITFGTATTTYLRNDGTWNTPTNTTSGTSYAAANVPNNTTFGTNGSIYNVYNATKHSTLTVSLAVASWNTTNKTISVTASGVTASNLVLVSPAPASTAVYSAAGVYCSAQASNSLTFTCSSIPTAAVTVNVVILS